MHDFDYDAMQKKRIARGAMHMKRGSKSKKCSLPHDGLTAAQLRRLNGPVSTYKMDEPMSWESFKAMPEDLQKKYIVGLQETYQANDAMLGKMFGRSGATVCVHRTKLGIPVVEGARINGKPAQIRDAKWEAFCNGVVGGKPGEPGEHVEEAVVEEEVADTCETAYDHSNDPNYIDDPIQIKELKDKLDKICSEPPKSEPIELVSVPGVPIPSKLDITFVEHLHDLNDLYRIVKTLQIPHGKCRIRISIEKFSERNNDRQYDRRWEDR